MALVKREKIMKIQDITFSMGRDFSAVMVCEHCGATHKITSGYDDHYYHSKVIQAMACRKCGKNREGVIGE